MAALHPGRPCHFVCASLAVDLHQVCSRSWPCDNVMLKLGMLGHAHVTIAGPGSFIRGHRSQNACALRRALTRLIPSLRTWGAISVSQQPEMKLRA